MLTELMSHSPVDYLAVGHVCHDLVPEGRVIGGAAAYSASTAQVLGCRAAIVTSSSAGDDWRDVLPGIAIHKTDAPATTTFENVYTPAGRVQTIHSVAGRLTADDVPPNWTRVPMVYLGPIANEVDPEIIQSFSNSMVGIGPQGWMRRWDEGGHVYSVDWQAAADVLPLGAVAFLSIEDLADPGLLEKYARSSKLLIMTDGARGCTVYCRDEVRAFAAPKVDAVDTTGAGDIFAAAYLVRLYQTGGDIWEAAEFANRIAARSVTCRGLPAKMEAVRRLLSEEIRQTAG